MRFFRKFREYPKVYNIPDVLSSGRTTAAREGESGIVPRVKVVV
jgi:hypothetical protein